MTKGIDYAFYPHPSCSAIRAEGATFVCRYTSSYSPNDTNGKNLIHAEKDVLLAAGLSIVIVAEEGARYMLGGWPAGVAMATHADAVAKALGMPGIPIYLAGDDDFTEAEQPALDACLDGGAFVIGRGRTGFYSGYYPLSRAFDAGKVTYGWQTYAWSGTPTLWDSRAQLRQVQNGVTIGGADCDRDVALAADYGQWPRPGTVTGDATITEGATGPGVTKAQGRLNVHSAAPAVTVDGTFGAKTTTAVKAFQGVCRLVTDGTIGPVTWTALNLAPPAPGQLPAPTGLAVDRKRLPVQWNPVADAAVTGYTCAAYGIDGREYARVTTAGTQTWCILNDLAGGGTYTVRVWANGGTVAPLGANLTVTLA